MTRPLARFALSLCSLVCLPVAANSASAEPVTTTAGPTIQASAALPATERRPLATVIDEYVRLARGSNLGLQAAMLEVERSQAALDAARGRFFPEATLGARYTRSEGGREVSLPLAAAFNPVYSTLNELLLADGKPARFGSISDPRFLLQREQEQDTRISVRQALYAPALPAALRAQRSLLEANEFARVALSQRLQRDVTIGYLDWLRASRGAVIVEASETLLAENLRITESLFRNGKVTQDQVLRAKAEWLAVGQQATETRNVRDQLQSYVNFLLNRALDTDLDDADADVEVHSTAQDLVTLRQGALVNRPEIGQIDRAVRAASSRVDLARAARKPTLALGVDGGTRRAEVREARIAEQQARTRREEVAQQIQLEVQQALDQLYTSEASLRTAEARAEAARAAFRIAGRKRDEGVISQVEFLDARTSLTAAELNLNSVRFELLARQAELDYATGVPQR